MASTVAGHKRAFGTDTVPGTYEDLELADLVVLTGSNLAWCHPVLYQRIAAAKAARSSMKVVVIDPRRTATCDIADLHLALDAGSDVALFNILLSRLHSMGAVDTSFVAKHVANFVETLDVASSTDKGATGLSTEDIDAFCALWIGTEKVVTVFSQGVNQSDHGADKVNAILNCHLATGRIGKPGMGPFSVTGQPNAMGGREVGGLANMLACHLDIENDAHRRVVGDFWNAPTMPTKPGLKAVDMFKAVQNGTIKALWVMCTNPAVSMPDANVVSAAIAACEFTVVSDLSASTDTAKLAQVVLPATGWSEKDGTVTNSERTISRQRSILPPPGQARHDWAIVCDVARRMGFTDGFNFRNTAEIFREHATLSGLAAAQGRDFDISGLASLNDAEYDDLMPTRWPVPVRSSPANRLFSDGKFFTKSGRANMVPVRQPTSSARPQAYPFRLNTGRIRDQWHTMTRTARAPRLNQHYGEPFLEVHPIDAAALGLKPAGLAKVKNALGSVVLRVLITDRVRTGTVFAPIHWTNESASAARVCDVVPSTFDPISGQPDSKAAYVSISRYTPAWFGFAVSANDISPATFYWAKTKSNSGWRLELAHDQTPNNWTDFATTLFGAPDADVSSVLNSATNSVRIALHKHGRLVGALFASPDPVVASRGFVSDQISTGAAGILAGKPGADQPDPGATICACFNVGLNTILDAIEGQNLMSVQAIGDALSAGTNCGSCQPELAALLHGVQKSTAAE